LEVTCAHVTGEAKKRTFLPFAQAHSDNE